MFGVFVGRSDLPILVWILSIDVFMPLFYQKTAKIKTQDKNSQAKNQYSKLKSSNEYFIFLAPGRAIDN